MQAIGSALILAVCVLGASALPNPAVDTNAIYQLMLSQMRSAMAESTAMSPGETVCADYYQKQTEKINILLASQTNACFDKANSTSWANQGNIDTTVDQMRKDLATVQAQLKKCSELTLAPLFLECINQGYDNNLNVLDQLNSQSFQVQAQFAVEQSNVQLVQDACISANIGSAKSNLTIVANDYNTCLKNIKNHRDFQPKFELN